PCAKRSPSCAANRPTPIANGGRGLPTGSRRLALAISLLSMLAASSCGTQRTRVLPVEQPAPELLWPCQVAPPLNPANPDAATGKELLKNHNVAMELATDCRMRHAELAEWAE